MTLNFIALFIVTPNLSSMPEIYGVYSMCVGLNVFLQYADLGFIKAGKKFASECIPIGDVDSERGYVGTSLVIYIIICLFLILGSALCVIYPDLIIKEVKNNIEILNIARKLLLVFMSSVPISVLEKFAGFIYSIRLLDFKIQRIQILGSIIKIASVPLVFFNDRYDIVSYYLFTQIVQLVCVSYIIYLSKDIGYGLKCFIKILKFNRKAFDKMKALAAGGFAASISWILYYELDTLAISAMLGPKFVAIYSVGRTLQTYIRTIIGIVYAPFEVRFNHFVGQRDYNSFLKFFSFISSIYSIIVIPVVVVVIFASPFIISWVGSVYKDSILITQLLVLCFVFNAFSNPCSSIIYSFNKVKYLLWISSLQPIIFWVGIVISVNCVGVDSFAIFKVFCCMFEAFYSYFVARKVLKIYAREVLFDNFVWPVILSSISVIIVYFYFIYKNNIIEKSYGNLTITLLYMSLACIVSFICYILFRPKFRKYLISIIRL